LSDTSNTLLIDNEHVKALVSVMQKSSTDTAEFTELLDHVTTMESDLKSAVSQISAMRRELSEMRDIQKHPIKAALQNYINKLETNIESLRVRLNELKAEVIAGAKNGMEAFCKEKGASALNSIMSFFNIKGCLQAIKNELTQNIQECSKAIAGIEMFSKHYHEAGKGILNMGRVLLGLKPVNKAKPVGKLAKSLEAPSKAHRAICLKMRKSVNKAIIKLEQLDNSVAERKETRTTEKQSLLKKLDANKERVKLENQERPVPELVKQQEHGV